MPWELIVGLVVGYVAGTVITGIVALAFIGASEPQDGRP